MAYTKKTTLVDTVYDKIRSDITQQLLKPGQKINIADLAERYGASQTPVKLALNRLISEKFVENYPRHGMQVRRIGVEDIEATFDARLMLALYCTSEAITTINYDEALRTSLKNNVEAHMKLVTAPDYADAPESYIENYRYDTEFHELYLKCTGNKLLLDMFRFINPFLYTNYIYRKQSSEKTIAGVQEHGVILNAILQEDEAALREALTIHSQNAKRAVGLILRVNEIF